MAGTEEIVDDVNDDLDQDDDTDSDTDADVDAGGDDDDGGTQPDKDGGADGGDDPPARSRGSRQFGELRRRAREAERERDEYRRLVEEARRAPAHPAVDPAQAEREERARLELMEPHEQTAYLLQKQQRQFDQKLNTIQFHIYDQSDRAAFDRLCAQKPLYEKVAAETERILADERRAGRPGASRKLIAEMLIGRSVVEKGGTAKDKQTAAAKARLAAQRGRPGAGSSDVGPQRGRSGNNDAATRNKRLEGVKF